MSNSQAYLKTSKTIATPGSNLVNVLKIFLSNLAKRSFDIVMSVIGLLLLSPVFLYVAMLIKRDSPGPVSYTHLDNWRRHKYNTRYCQLLE